MKRVFYVSLFFSLFLFACNNDDDSSQDEQEQEVEENFYALKIGNNWKYEYFKRIDQTEDFETLGIIEELLIIETTEIDGEAYFVFQSTTTGNENGFSIAPENGVTTKNVRDSLGYLIALDHDHPILFSNENTDDYLIYNNTWGDVYGVLLGTEENITVEAGTFLCKQNEIYAIDETGDIFPGRDKIYFSDGIGEIYRQYSAVSTSQYRWEKRLIEYEIVD